MSVATRKRSTTRWLFEASGVLLVGHGLYFVLARPALLPGDLRYMGADAQSVEAAVPRLVTWLGKVFTVMGGFMTGTGVLVLHLCVEHDA